VQYVFFVLHLLATLLVVVTNYLLNSLPTIGC